MRITGTVIHGDGYGRTIGFPTANLDHEQYVANHLNPTRGIYAGWVQIIDTGIWHKAGIVIGPDDNEGIPRLEAHLLDYSGDLYGQQLLFELTTYIRAFETYPDETALRAAIAADIETIKNLDLCSPE